MVENNCDFSERLPEFINVIIEVAQGNFDRQISMTEKKDELDALAVGINMMIDDLKSKTELQKQNDEIQEENAKLLKVNKEANKVKEKLEIHKNNLEELILKRTFELEEKNKELENFNELFVGREFRIKELKDKIIELENELRKNL